MNFSKELSELEVAIKHGDQFNLNTSKSGSYWHIDHCLKTILLTIKLLRKSDTTAYRWRFNFLRSIVFTFGAFPRGRAKAPKAVLPPDLILEQDLKSQYKEAIEVLNQIQLLDPNCNFDHPYFGRLNLKQSLKFLKIHTRHHLKIIADI